MSAELDRNPVQGGRMFRSGGNWGVASGTGVPRTCPLCTSAEAVTRHRFDPLRPLALQVSEAAGHRSDMIRGRLESCPARESIARHCDAQGERISPDRTAWGRVTYRFAMCALVLVASAAILSPAGADEDAAGLLGVLSDLFKRPQDSAVNVPKRRKTKEPSTAVVPGEASGHDESVQSSPPVPQAVVPKRREGVQPSHVLQAVQDLISEIGILRGELKVRDFPPEAELVEDRAPIYVYAKSLEALTKVVGAQRRLGVVPVARVDRIPLKEVDDGDVLAHIELLLGELRRIKAHMRIERRIQPTQLGFGTSYSMIYKNLADASFMLDGLRGRPVTPDDVYLMMSI